MVREFVARVDHIMHNHTGTGIAIFWVQPPPGFYIDPDILDRWFQAVIPQGIIDFGAFLGYTFPCSLLSRDSHGCSTITSFTITGCRLGYIDRVGCLVSLRMNLAASCRLGLLWRSWSSPTAMTLFA